MLLLLITSFLIGVILIPKVNASPWDILRYDFEKDSLVDSVDKDNINLRHSNIITQDYNSSYSFKNEINYTNTDISFVDFNDFDSCIVLNNSDNHKEVLYIYDSADWQNLYHLFDSNIEYGSIEFWIKFDNSNTDHRIIIYNNGDIFFYLAWSNTAKLQIYYSADWHDVVGYSIDTWYHIRVDFECGNNLYKGLLQDKMFIYVDNIKYGSFSTSTNQESINKLFITSNDNSITCLDSFGFNWLSNYTLGLNKYPIINITDSNLLTSDKYEFNLDDNGNPYAKIGYPDVDFWDRVSQYSFEVFPDTPHFYAKSKNINGIKIFCSQDSSATGIKNESLGLLRDKFNITFGFQILLMTEISSSTIFRIDSLNNTEIIRLRFDTQTNTKTNLKYYDGSSYQDLVSIHGINSSNVYNFNLYIYNFSVNLSWYKNDVYNNTYSFPLIDNLLGINRINFYSYDDATGNSDYYTLRLNYIGIYQYNVSLTREYGYLDYELIDDWNLNYHNVLSVNVYNQTIKILASGKIEGFYSYEIFNEFDNNSFSYNFHGDERIIENAHLFLIIQSTFNLSESIYLLIERVKLNKYIDNVFDREMLIGYYYHNLNNQSYYYVDDLNRLLYHIEFTQNDTLEYMMLYFNFISGISSNYMTIYFKCRELSFSIGSGYIAMTYYQPPDNHFYLKTYETTINTLLERGAEFRRFHFVITDKNNNNYTNNIGVGYLSGLKFRYYPYGIISELDIITLSLLAIIIPLIIIITPTIGIYSIYKKKEIVIPMLLLMSIICYATLLIPFELFFIMLLCYGCGIFIQYKKGGFNQE